MHLFNWLLLQISYGRNSLDLGLETWSRPGESQTKDYNVEERWCNSECGVIVDARKADLSIGKWPVFV